MDVVVAELGVVDGAAQVGAVDEHVEVGAGGRRRVVVVDRSVVAARQVDAEAFPRALDVGRSRSEQRHVVSGLGQHLGDRAVDLLAAADVDQYRSYTDRPAAPAHFVTLQVIDVGHFVTIHDNREPRSTDGRADRRARNIAGSLPA